MERALLDNGLRLIMKRRQDVKTVAITVIVRTGSINENKNNNGIAHFVEHMLLRGTRKYSQNKLLEMIQSAGGIFDAITQKTYTKYEINTRSESVNSGLGVLYNILFDSVFDESSVAKERGVVLEEIKQQMNDPFILSRVLFEKEVHKSDPLSLCILGTEETIKKITRNELYLFYKKYYVPNSMVIAVVGNISYADVERKVKELFGKNNKGERTEQSISTKIPITKRETELNKDGLKQSHIIIGWCAPTIFDDEKYAMEIIMSVLGKNMNSRLSMKFINELGIAYKTGAEFNDKEGYCFCNLAISPENTNLAKITLLKIIANFIENGITKNELQSTKNYIKGIKAYFQELNRTLSEQYGIAESFTKAEEVELYDKKIDSIMLEEINKTIKKFISKDKYTMVTLKPSD